MKKGAKIAILSGSLAIALVGGGFIGYGITNAVFQRKYPTSFNEDFTKINDIIYPEEPQIQIEVPDGFEPKYEVLDSHLHFLDFLQTTDGFKNLTNAMDAAGVKDSILFGMPMSKMWDENSEIPPTYYLSNDDRCYYNPSTDYKLANSLLCQSKEVQKRFYPFISGVNTTDRYAAMHIRQLLDTYPNFWCGIGEIMSRHDDLTALTYGDAPHVNSQIFKDIFDIGGEYGLPVLIHHNITGQNVDTVIYKNELKEALNYAANKNCKVIWAHMGISRRVNVKKLSTIIDEMLRDHSNLYVDISWVVYDYYFLDNFPDGFKSEDTWGDWKNLINKYQNRILIGTDKVGHWKTYPSEVIKYYRLLDDLTPEVANKICRQNALSLIKKY